MRMRSGMIYVGTSGWIYKDWAKSFYPQGVAAKDRLRFYAKRFPTVEINASFYRLPTAAAFAKWRAQVYDGFLYSVKGSRAVTHYKRLLPGAKSLGILLDRCRALEDRLGPILWQLPGSMKKDLGRLSGFLATLPRDLRQAVEFRDPSWLEPGTFAVLRDAGIAHVAVSSLRMPACHEVTANFTYVRFHGLEGGAAHDYSEEELRPWAEFLRGCAGRGITAFVYFNNDVNTRAPQNALMLMTMLGGAVASTSPLDKADGS
ncbi:MAG: DUF72 domain-containing protein [Verrucomicrobia bacterium]|nr:DUF72 domain-containing protein [Verrucomicrobiota bacterium]